MGRGTIGSRGEARAEDSKKCGGDEGQSFAEEGTGPVSFTAADSRKARNNPALSTLQLSASKHDTQPQYLFLVFPGFHLRKPFQTLTHELRVIGELTARNNM